MMRWSFVRRVDRWGGRVLSAVRLYRRLRHLGFGHAAAADLAGWVREVEP